MLIGNQKINTLTKNPFLREKIVQISVILTKSYEGTNWICSGHVAFNNQNTHGQQLFKGDTFDAVVLDIKSFLETLN